MGNTFAKKKEAEPELDVFDELVKKFLDNKDINLTFLPDSIESKIYKKLLKMGISEIKQLVSTVKIQFLDFEITMDMHPIPKNDLKNYNLVN